MASVQLSDIFFNERVVVAFIAEVFTTVVMAFLTYRIYVRYKERKHPATKYLALATLFFSFTASFQLLDLLYLTPVAGIRNVGYSLAFSWSAIANIAICFFMLEIFSSGIQSGGWKAKAFIGAELGVAILSPILGIFFASLLIIVLGLHVLVTFLLYFTLVQFTTRAIISANDPNSRRGFSYIRLGAILIITAFTMFVLDQIAILVIVPDGYSWFNTIGWTSAGLAGIFLYSGFVLPGKRKEAQ